MFIIKTFFIYFLLYYILRSPILVNKDVVKLAVEEGGISSIKVIIILKNRSQKTYENIRIIEKQSGKENIK